MMIIFVRRLFIYYCSIYFLVNMLIWSLPNQIARKIDLLLSFIYNRTVGLMLNQPIYQPIENADSSDALINYFLILIIFFISLGLCAFLKIKDSTWKNKDVELKWSIFICRVYLATNLFYYGLYKVIPVQFSELNLFQLLKPLSEYSSGSLVWAFMGYSTPYQIISGCLEFIAGVFILFPRWTNLGSFIAIVVMSNVFMLNIFYNMSIKVGSFHVLLASFFLFSTQMKAWFYFLILNKIIPQNHYPQLFKSKFKNLIVVFWVGIFFTFFGLKISTKAIERYNKNQLIEMNTNFYGLWKTQENQKNLPEKWKRFIFPRPGAFYIQTFDNEFIRFNINKSKDSEKMYEIENMEENSDKSKIEISEKSNLLLIKGTINQREINLSLEKEDAKTSTLLSRKFRLISNTWDGR